MKSIRDYINIINILNENINIGKTLQNYGSQLENRIKSDHSASNLSPTQLIQQIIEADPTQNKSYALWILRKYLNNGIRYIEDLSRVNVALNLFYRNKLKLPVEQRDINKIRNLSDLENLIEQFKEKKTTNEIKKEEKDKIYKETIIYYKGKEGVILIPKTKEASCFWGQGTKWCTAATESKNYFHDYNKDGPLYIIICKDGSKYQIHIETGSLMNEEDERINEKEQNKIQWAIDKILNTEEKQIVAIQNNVGIIKYIKNPTEKVQLTAVKIYCYAIQSIENPSEKVQLVAVKKRGNSIGYIKYPTEKVQLVAVKDDPEAISDIDNPTEKVQIAAIKQYPYVFEYIKNPTEKVKKLFKKLYW